MYSFSSIITGFIFVYYRCGIQNYNNPNAFNFDQWHTWAKSAKSQIFLGVPGSSTSGSGYLPASSVQSILSDLTTKYGPQANGWFGGVMMWDVGTGSFNTDGNGQSFATTLSSYLKGKSTCKPFIPPSSNPSSNPPSNPPVSSGENTGNPPVSGAGSPNGPLGLSPGSTSQNSLSAGVISAIVIGILLFVCFIAVLIYKRRRGKKDADFEKGLGKDKSNDTGYLGSLNSLVAGYLPWAAGSTNSINKEEPKTKVIPETKVLKAPPKNNETGKKVEQSKDIKKTEQPKEGKKADLTAQPKRNLTPSPQPGNKSSQISLDDVKGAPVAPKRGETTSKGNLQVPEEPQGFSVSGFVSGLWGYGDSSEKAPVTSSNDGASKSTNNGASTSTNGASKSTNNGTSSTTSSKKTLPKDEVKVAKTAFGTHFTETVNPNKKTKGK